MTAVTSLIPGLDEIVRHGDPQRRTEAARAIAFSTSLQMRIRSEDNGSTRKIEVLANEGMSPLFLAVIEATEEAVYNSLLRATTITGRGHTVEALPIEKITAILRKYGAIK